MVPIANDVDEEFFNRIHNYFTSEVPSRLDQHGRVEHVPSGSNLLKTIKSQLITIPYTYLTLQLIWTCAIIAIGYVIGSAEKEDQSTLSTGFWTTRLSISSDVSFGVGWALFVLLGFFVSAASARYYKAQKCIAGIGAELERLVRCLLLGYKRGVWHENDYERIISYIIAYPIALKMQLRNERDEKQLANILNRFDVQDVISSNHMHLHCSRIIRGYIGFAESKYANNGSDPAVLASIIGNPNKSYAMNLVDNIDSLASAVMTIYEFQPSVGYVNHLRIYLYIWMMFLPLSLISDGGW